jgi:hypothetical protein
MEGQGVLGEFSPLFDYIVMMCLIILIFLCSCSYSITMVHTEDKVSDMVDEEQTRTATINPEISLTR